MKRVLLFIASAVIALSASATSAKSVKVVEKSALKNTLFRFAPKAKAEMREIGSADRANARMQKGAKDGMQVKTASQNFLMTTLPAADEQGFMDGPNDETWYYTMDYVKELVDHGAWKEYMIKGYKITVYDAAFKVVGTVEDNITLAEGETKVAQIEVGTLVTQKFFNFDTSYEIMVGIACNTVDYVNNYSTRAYTIGKNEPVATFAGYYVSAVNTATDAWSEKYWITFQTEEETETPEINGIMNTVDYVFKTYKSAGYSGMEDPKLTVRIPGITTAGENAIPFLSASHNGMPYFATNRMKYCWYEDPFDYTNDNPTADNELICDIYTAPSAWASDIELYSTTKIASTATLDNCFFLYNGAFSYNDDISFGRYTADDTPSLIITREHFVPDKDEYSYDYFVATAAPKGETADGVKTVDLATDVLGGFFMSDIAGESPMVMFAKATLDGNYSFDFTDLVTGEVKYNLPFDLGNGVYLTTETDRVATTGGYLLVSPQTYGSSDEEGNMYTNVAYVTTTGEIDHIDALNLGQNVDLAQIYSNVNAFNPYIFNIDDAREYLVLVKRRDVPGQVGNHEELLVVSSNPEKGILLQLIPDAELGSLRYISLVNIGKDNPVMSVIYYNGEKMTNQNYSLPLSLYEEGEGTMANPYVITTVGGLQQIKANPAAHYVLGCDIDAAGNEVNNTKNFVFSGSLDGRGHIVSNLKVTGRSLLPMVTAPDDRTQGNVYATVKDINFVNPVFNATADGQGLLIGNASGATVSGIHVYGGKVSGEAGVAGLVGKAALYTTISGCSFDGEVTCTGDEYAAGIVGSILTSTTVSACAFTGKISGDNAIGGIVSSTSSNAGAITDCHVNADIKGKHTIGGIVGESMRAPIANCHVEGTIEATESPRWDGGPKAGGIVGELYPASSSTGTEEGEEPVTPVTVIKGCYVNLTSLTFSGTNGEEEYPGQNDTMHRIVGKSSVNSEPEIVDYDQEYNPIYGDPVAPEASIADNYAVASLAKVAEAIADDATTTEGKSIAKDETGVSFFTGLGWAYGNTVAEPWSMTGDQTCPSLYFEGGLLIATPAEATVEVDEELTVELSLAGDEITEEMLDGFVFEMSDESMLEMTNMGAADGKISITLKALKEGKATLTFGLNGKTATVNVTVVKASAIAKVNAENAAIRVNGRTVTAEGCVIDVYSISGAHLTKGNGNVTLNSAAAAGVYVIKATAADGTVTSAKMVIR